jgi:hypothetical protein
MDLTNLFLTRFRRRTLLEFAKKKRKRTDSGSDVDLDVTPPRSPLEDGGTPIEKRRSGRNANKLKKYVDEIDLNLSDEDLSALPSEFVASGGGGTGGTGVDSKAESAVASAVPSVINEDRYISIFWEFLASFFGHIFRRVFHRFIFITIFQLRTITITILLLRMLGVVFFESN